MYSHTDCFYVPVMLRYELAYFYSFSGLPLESFFEVAIFDATFLSQTKKSQDNNLNNVLLLLYTNAFFSPIITVLDRFLELLLATFYGYSSV